MSVAPLYIVTEKRTALNIYLLKMHFVMNVANRAKDNIGHGNVFYDHPLTKTGYYRIFSTNRDNFKLTIIDNPKKENSKTFYQSSTESSEHFIEIKSDETNKVQVISLDRKVFNNMQVKMFEARNKAKRERERLVWNNLHFLAYNVIQDPLSLEQQNQLSTLLNVLRDKGIYCGKCKQHYDKFRNEYRLKMEDVTKNKTNFATFLLDYHNSVNKSIKRPEFSAEEAEKYYTSNLDEWREKHKITIEKAYLDGNIKSFFNWGSFASFDLSQIT